MIFKLVMIFLESLAGIKINSKILDEFKIYKQHTKNPNHIQRMNAINSLK